MTNRRRWLGVLASTALVLGMSVAVGPPAYAASPGNDSFSAAVALPGTASGSTTGTNLDATMETDESTYWANSSASVWWTWVAPADGTYLFDTCGSAFNAGLGLWTGSAVDALSNARARDHECYLHGNWFWNDAAEIDAVAGQTYRIQVLGSQGSMGDVVLRWWAQARPGNDDFADAVALPSTTSGTTTGTNRFATNETDDPSYLADKGTVWWAFTPPSTGTYRIDLCGSNFDSLLAIYSGSTLATLVQRAASDDACALQSATTLPYEAGTTYYVGVSGYGTGAYSMGDIRLNWQLSSPPANDAFDARVTLPSTGSGSATGENRFATYEQGEPSYLTMTTWWSWTAPADGMVVFDTCGSDYLTQLAAFTGDAVDALTVVAGPNTRGCFIGSMVGFAATQGTSYAISVGSTSAQGDISLHWSMGSPPANDDFADATELSGSGGTTTGSTMYATTETDEPYAAGTHTVWWKWAAPDTNPVTFDTCGSPVVEATFGVYRGTSVGTLTPVPVSSTYSCGHMAATFTPVARAVYYLAVGSDDDGMGGVVLHWPASGTAAVLPSVTTHPQSTTVASGVSAQFTAAATGDPTPTVQWQVSTNSGTTWTDLTGSTTTTLNVSGTYAKNGYQYRAVFSNPAGDVPTDAATLTVTPLSPSVTTQPSNASVGAGLPVEFSSAATGDPTPTVQWQRSTDGGTTWLDISAATTGTLSLPSAEVSMNGYRYRAVFTNAGGSTPSNAATLTVIDPSNATVTGLAVTVSKGWITFTFTPAGTPTATHFQCMLSGGGAKVTTWTACTSGYRVKSGGKTGSVHAGWTATGPWGSATSVPVTRG